MNIKRRKMMLGVLEEELTNLLREIYPPEEETGVIPGLVKEYEATADEAKREKIKEQIINLLIQTKKTVLKIKKRAPIIREEFEFLKSKGLEKQVEEHSGKQWTPFYFGTKIEDFIDRFTLNKIDLAISTVSEDNFKPLFFETGGMLNYIRNHIATLRSLLVSLRVIGEDVV